MWNINKHKVRVEYQDLPIKQPVSFLIYNASQVLTAEHLRMTEGHHNARIYLKGNFIKTVTLRDKHTSIRPSQEIELGLIKDGFFQKWEGCSDADHLGFNDHAIITIIKYSQKQWRISAIRKAEEKEGN